MLKLAIASTRRPFAGLPCGQCLRQTKRYFCEQPPSGDAGAKRVSLAKKLFSTLLFGGTLAAAVYMKKRRRDEQNELFKECTMVPRDENYSTNMYFYNYKDYVFPAMIIKSLPQVQALKARPDDVFVVSFPKTGEDVVSICLLFAAFRRLLCRRISRAMIFVGTFLQEVCFPSKHRRCLATIGQESVSIQCRMLRRPSDLQGVDRR